MPSSFDNKKELRFIITLATGKFGSSNNNQITLEGFRATVDIDKAGGNMMGTLRAAIYGVAQSDMNSITTLQYKVQTLIPNTVQVYAVDGDQVSLVFQGNIVNAWGDYGQMPDVFLMIQAQAAYVNQLQPVAPTSLQGQVDVASTMNQLANAMGLTFENNGVNVQLNGVYLPNTALEQAKNLARQANINLVVDDTILAITPQNMPRTGTIPEISAQSGLVGYPTFDGVGVNFRTFFNPAIKFQGSVKLVSTLKQAAGTWIVSSMSHHLQSETIGGAWFTQVRGNTSGVANVD